MQPLFAEMFLQSGMSAKQPGYFFPVFLGLLIAGGIGWLVALVLMSRKQLLFAVSALIAGAAVLFAISKWRDGRRRGRPAFVYTDGARFMIDGQPFRFVGANVAVMYRDEDRARMPETLQQ